MNPALQNAVRAQLAAIKAMIASVEELIGISELGGSTGPHRTVERKPPEDPHYLPEDAELEVEKQMAALMAEAASAAQKEKFLGEVMSSAAQQTPSMRGQ